MIVVKLSGMLERIDGKALNEQTSIRSESMRM